VDDLLIDYEGLAWGPWTLHGTQGIKPATAAAAERTKIATSNLADRMTLLHKGGLQSALLQLLRAAA
jgi:hypothetical protein